jgi:NAD(P)-dependent dehydrogenase (short-subunit alcohol dehydrogenase family)
MSSQVWLVSGANRGIGLEFVKQISSRKDVVVFATARNPAKATELNELASKNPNIHLLQLESTSAADATTAALQIEKIAGGLDVVIANAGIANNWQDIIDVDIASFQEHLQVNVVGTLILFKAMYPLLLKRHTRKFIAISTLAASFKNMLPIQGTVYGASKVGLNWVTKSIHNELGSKGFIAFPLNPGAVDTDMGKSASDKFGWGDLPLKAPESVAGMLKIIDQATSEQSGRFLSYDGAELEW